MVKTLTEEMDRKIEDKVTSEKTIVQNNCKHEINNLANANQQI